MPQPPPDHYRVLNVHPSARVETIHSAYRDLARKAHPDVSGDESAMKQLNAAWDTLRDPRRRAEYDRERLMANHAEPPVVVASPAAATVTPHRAGPARGQPFGPIMSFGRYEGWSLGQIAQHDPAWLRALRRTPSGRQFARDIDAVFEELEARPHTLGGRRGAIGTNGRRSFTAAGAES
jgi:curved DNA-binding protein CbpA